MEKEELNYSLETQFLIRSAEIGFKKLTESERDECYIQTYRAFIEERHYFLKILKDHHIDCSVDLSYFPLPEEDNENS